MTRGRDLPRLLRWLLRRVLPHRRRDDVLGDLEESWRARAARLGEGAARRRLWREAAALLLWHAGATLAPGAPAGSGATDPAPRGERTTTMGRDFLQDIRFAVRTLARRPGFALTAVAVLGLGIGAPTTVLTLVNRIFLQRPEGVVEPHRLVRVWRSWAPGQGGGSLGNPDYAYYRENVTTLRGLAAFGGSAAASYSLDGVRSDQLDVTFVSDNFFDVLGVRPALGRFLLAGDNAGPGADPVVVVSDAFWRRALAADPAAAGRTLTLNGITFTVVGVAPPGFRGLSPFAEAADAWAPIAQYGALTRASDGAWWERLPTSRSNWLSVVGRLAPGRTFEAAEAELAALSGALTYPGRGEEEGVMVTREYLYTPRQASSLASLSWMLLGVVGIVLAIAVANVAVLLLSRATTRGREMGIRTAMGAARGRLLRQLLAESLALGLAGGAVGVGLAWAFADAAASLLPYSFVGTFHPDGRVLLAAVAISLVGSTLAGLAPALHASRPGAAMAGDGVRATGRRSRVRDALVVGQVALSLVLVAGAVLFARSFRAARSQDLGFATDRILIVETDLRAQGYSRDEGLAFIPRALERLAALPGADGVATSRMVPFQGDWSTDLTPPPGARPNREDGTLSVGLNAISGAYFDVMDVGLAAGRPLGPEDGATGAPVVVINETLAGLLFPGQDPLGRAVRLRRDTDFTVVGVARDATYYELGEEPTTQAYGSVFQVWQPQVAFLVRTAGPPAALAAAAQAALREIDPALAFARVSTMEAVFGDVTARYQVSAVLVGLFGLLAVILAAAGLFGVVSFLVAQRTREIGVRMALGAGRGRIAAEVVRTGLVLAGVGVLLGIAGALGARRLTGALLYGVGPDDPWALPAASLLLALVAVAASLGPARRTTRVDPLEAIRSE